MSLYVIKNHFGMHIFIETQINVSAITFLRQISSNASRLVEICRQQVTFFLLYSFTSLEKRFCAVVNWFLSNEMLLTVSSWKIMAVLMTQIFVQRDLQHVNQTVGVTAIL